MNPQWQQQQQQMQRMREQQMKQGYWQQQQNQKKLQNQQMKRKWGKKPPTLPERESLGSAYPASDPFTQVEKAIMQLRQDLAAGKLTQEQANARLDDLYVKDKQGNWWTVGIDSGEWYCFDGSQWSPKRPPGHRSITPMPAASRPVVVGTKKHPFLGLMTFVFGMIVTVIFGFFVGNFIYQITYSNGLALLVAIAIWVLGTILTIKDTRKRFGSVTKSN